MKEYIEREAVCYQLSKQETIDGQPRAIRRAKRLVEEFPASDVRHVVFCKDCGHWSAVNQHLDRSGNYISCCAWYSRHYGIIETSAHDFCSYGYTDPRIVEAKHES